MKNLFIHRFLYLLLFNYVFSCFIFYSNAQTSAQWLKHGDKSFLLKDYYGASKYYKEALLQDSNNLHIINKYAHSLRLYNDYLLAEKYYQLLYHKDKSKNFTETVFWLATMQKNNAKYQIARKNFIKATQIFKDKESYYYLKSSQEVLSCEYAQELMKDTLKVNILNVGKPINTVNSDFAGFQSSSNSLIFSSLRADEVVLEQNSKSIEFKVQIFQANFNPISAHQTDSIKEIWNAKGENIANGTIDLVDSLFYFTHCPATLPCAIWAKDLKNTYKLPYPLEAPVNIKGFTNTQAHIASIGGQRYLFFVSDRTGGFGKLDIWASRYVNNQFETPQNLGKTINSIDDEISPFYSKSDSSLYFSSNWHLGLGGFDIFKSRMKNPIDYAKPVNLGYPINSSANDLYYSKHPDSQFYLLTSNRVGAITSKSATCCNDIWYYADSVSKISLPLIPGLADSSKVFEFQNDLISQKNSASKSNLLLENQLVSKPIYLYFDNDIPNPKSTATYTNINYNQTFVDYMNAKSVYITKNISSEQNSLTNNANNEIEHFFENKLKVGKNLLDSLLTKVNEYLKNGYSIELDIKGTASPLADTDYNFKLSQRRIVSFVNYLKIWNNSSLKPYLTEATNSKNYLKLVQMPVGEHQASKEVSDNYFETLQSVYSLKAALERRIEIIGARVIK